MSINIVNANDTLEYPSCTSDRATHQSNYYINPSNGGHTHTCSYAGTSGNITNANMPAYYTCYIWRRVS